MAYVLLTVGSLLFAIGDVMFVAICMDIPLLIIGTWILGPKFGVKTIVSTALIFLFTFILESKWGYNPVIHEAAGALTASGCRPFE